MKKMIYTVLFFTACIPFISCNKENSCDNCISNPPTTNNKPPIASAGPDQIITLPVNNVEVNGIGSSDPDGTIVSYLWTKIYGPDTFNIVNVSAVKTVINDLVKGNYQFELTVKGNTGIFAKDTVQITVNPTQPPPPPASGNSVSFWILNADDNYYGSGYISINNETKVANCSWLDTGPPNCNDACTVNFKLTPGTHTWKAWTTNSTDTVKGTVTIGQSCILQKIEL